MSIFTFIKNETIAEIVRKCLSKGNHWYERRGEGKEGVKAVGRGSVAAIRSQKVGNIPQSQCFLLWNCRSSWKGNIGMRVRLHNSSLKHKRPGIGKIHRLSNNNAIDAWQHNRLENIERSQQVNKVIKLSLFILHPLSFSYSMSQSAERVVVALFAVQVIFLREPWSGVWFRIM